MFFKTLFRTLIQDAGALFARMHVSVFWFDQFFQRMLERRVIQVVAEFLQCGLCFIAEFVRGRFGLQAIEGNLHLDADSANLAAPAQHLGRQLGCQLAQFCSDSGICNGDAERSELQAQNLCLAGLRKIRRGDTDKMALQGR